VSDDQRTLGKTANRLAASSGSYSLAGPQLLALGTPETAGAVAKSRFDEPRWPRDRALAWIAFRRIEALTLSYRELDLRRHAALRPREDAEPPEMPLVSKDPARELLTALTAGKLEAVGPDHKPLPAASWDDRSLDPKTWPNVRLLRDDVLRLWPAVETLAAEGHGREGAPLEAKAGEEVAAPPPERAPQSVPDAANARGMSPADIGRAGGKKSGEVRRARRKWVPHATELAKAACASEPAASHERVAVKIADTWKLREPACPAPRTLSRWVSKQRANSELPPRSGSRATRSG
jgi:hypothetical protein